MKDALSIKEFSKLSGIEVTTLRYWDDIGLFSPERRDPNNDYRYYSPWQIIAVNFVTVLRNLGIPLKMIREIEKTRSPENIMDLIEHQEHLLDKEIRRLLEAHSVIRTRRELIRLGQGADATQITVVKQPERAIILGPPNEEHREPGSFFASFIHFCNCADELHINLDYPIGGRHESAERFFACPSEPDYFFSLDPHGTAVRAAGLYLTAYAYGHYGVFNDLPERMAAYSDENDLVCEGPVYVTYLYDEVSMKDPAQYLSQICIAVSRKAEDQATTAKK
ncbi:MAG: MerR family transcriptional regulator [Actinomycetia bacterium]|nr:MerR family transcriptional regulator [Actinomycetes bacterium]